MRKTLTTIPECDDCGTPHNLRDRRCLDDWRPGPLWRCDACHDSAIEEQEGRDA